MKIDRSTRDWLLEIRNTKRVYLEGNALKILESDDGDVEFEQYINESTLRDKEYRKKRLEVTKQVQDQNRILKEREDRIKAINEELTHALAIAETSRKQADDARQLVEKDLDVLQKRSQFELIGTIVRVALFVIVGVGAVTTLMYIISIFSGKDTQIISSTWSNMFGILLTNAFSIVGTIMGVKYASDERKKP